MEEGRRGGKRGGQSNNYVYINGMLIRNSV